MGKHPFAQGTDFGSRAEAPGYMNLMFKLSADSSFSYVLEDRFGFVQQFLGVFM